jgi:hypothetical protein
MREVRKGRVDGIVAYKLDRLGRSLSRLAQLVGEMTAHRAALVIPPQGIDTSASNPASQLQLNNVESFHPFRYCDEQASGSTNARTTTKADLSKPLAASSAKD